VLGLSGRVSFFGVVCDIKQERGPVIGLVPVTLEPPADGLPLVAGEGAEDGDEWINSHNVQRYYSGFFWLMQGLSLDAIIK
jgi:hypothetical protein